MIVPADFESLALICWNRDKSKPIDDDLPCPWPCSSSCSSSGLRLFFLSSFSVVDSVLESDDETSTLPCSAETLCSSLIVLLPSAAAAAERR